MKIPPDAIIAKDKLTAYLLVPKAHNGTFYQVEGMLKGVNGVELAVVTIWMGQNDGQFKFITLVPRKESQ